MDLGLNETQRMLQSGARDFLRAECPPSYVRDMERDARGFAPEMWEAMAGMGWLGLTLPTEYGGEGLSCVELAILLEEMGAALLPGPYFSTTVMAGAAIERAGSDAQKREYLTAIAQGRLTATLALTEPSGRWDAAGVQTAARETAGGWVLDGVKLYVPNANVSDLLIVAARTGEGDTDVSLFILQSGARGVTETALDTIASDRQSEIVFDGALVPKTALLGEVNGGWETLRHVLTLGAVGKSAEALGIARRVLDMTVEYLKTRTQFGRAIGSFQAMQHHAADMATDVEGCRQLTYLAASALAQGAPAEREAAMAKAWTSDAVGRVCALAHQCHGAIGFTMEHDLQLYTRRAKAAELMFGDAEFHLDAAATAMGL